MPSEEVNSRIQGCQGKKVKRQGYAKVMGIKVEACPGSEPFGKPFDKLRASSGEAILKFLGTRLGEAECSRRGEFPMFEALRPSFGNSNEASLSRAKNFRQ